MICANRRAPPRRGRPRDPAIDARILTSALRLFGRTGWSDFSIEKTAKSADVSKVTLYLRWQDKTSLLIDALHFAYPTWVLDEARSAAENLITVVEAMIHEFTDETGWAVHRALRDPGLPSELRDCCRKIVADRLEALDRLVDANGAPGHGVDPRLIRKCLVGTAMGEAGDVLLTGRLPSPDDARIFARDAVRLILAGLRNAG
jgi:AcrR family transcriptional regulator